MDIQRTVQNPYVGLRAFESADSLFFFGRNEQVASLAQRLERRHFLAILGSSGCGKSSLVRAGLIPMLQAGFIVEERYCWLVVEMKPGNHPLKRLAEAVSRTAERSADDLLSRIRREGVRAVLSELRPALERDHANCLFLVDQFEELFRFRAPEKTEGPDAEARDFVSLLLQLAEQKELPVYVTLTMRSDFMGDCSAFNGLPEAMNQSQYLVPRLNRRQLREAITGPARLMRATIRPDLVDRLINSQSDTPDDLPVLQHLLMRLWDKWQERGAIGEIGMEEYEAVGGISRALAEHAEEALKGMTPEELDQTRGLFQALTTTDAANRRIRRPKRLSQIAAITGAAPADLLRLIDRFRLGGRSFLIVSDEEDPLVDISHESLIRQWPRLLGWVDEEAERVAVGRRLLESARRWRVGKGGLLPTVDLLLARQWQASRPQSQAWAALGGLEPSAIDSFIEQSVRQENERIEREAAAKQKQQEREMQLALAEARARSLLWLKRLAVVAFCFAAAAMGLAIWVWVAKTRAEELQEQYMEAAEKNENLVAELGKSLAVSTNVAAALEAEYRSTLDQLAEYKRDNAAMLQSLWELQREIRSNTAASSGKVSTELEQLAHYGLSISNQLVRQVVKLSNRVDRLQAASRGELPEESGRTSPSPATSWGKLEEGLRYYQTSTNRLRDLQIQVVSPKAKK